MSRRAEQSRAVPLRRRLLQLICVLVVVVVAAGALLAVTVVGLRDAQDDSRNRLRPAVTDAQQLMDVFVNQETGERGFVITGDPAFLEPYRSATARLPQVVADLRDHASGIAAVPSAVDQVLLAHEQWMQQSVLPEISAAQQGNLARARQLVAQGAGRQQFDALRARTDVLEAQLSRRQAESSRQVQGLTTRLTWLLAATLTVLAVLVALLYPALQHLVVGPLQRFARTARRAGRDLTVPIVVTGPREIVDAAEDVEGMRRRLVEEIEKARQAVEALRQRGPAVLALREALAPGRVHVPGVDLASRLEPAEGVLAGDWFDALELGVQRIGLVLGDVAGHGPGPAVFALRLKHLLSAALVDGSPPGEAMSRTARQVGETDELFATVFVAVIDVAEGRLTYANAGHPAALLVPERDRAPLELAPTGPLLSSMMRSSSWGTVARSFTSGDLLLTFTDGLVEARSASGQEYGTGRLVAAVEEMPSGGPLDGLLDRLVADVVRHAGGRAADDVTVVACRRT